MVREEFLEDKDLPQFWCLKRQILFSWRLEIYLFIVSSTLSFFSFFKIHSDFYFFFSFVYWSTDQNDSKTKPLYF